MFFRREKPHAPSFDERLARLRRSGFTVEPDGPGQARVARRGCAAKIADGGERARVADAGLLCDGEPAFLVDGGFQKFWVTKDGRRFPARAEELRVLHDFQEDLRAALGLVSLYNEALGTTCSAHRYDRVQDRDRGVPRRPWD